MKKIIPTITMVLVTLGFIGFVPTTVLAAEHEENWTWGHNVEYPDGTWEFHCDGTGTLKCVLNTDFETFVCYYPGYICSHDGNHYFKASIMPDGSVMNSDDGSIVLVVSESSPLLNP